MRRILAVAVKVVLWLLTIACVLLLMCKIEILPECLRFVSNASCFEVLLNLSYSYLAGLIFYILNSYVPKMLSTTQAGEVLKPYLADISIYISHLYAMASLLDKESNCKRVNVEFNQDAFFWIADGKTKSIEKICPATYVSENVKSIEARLSSMHELPIVYNLSPKYSKVILTLDNLVLRYSQHSEITNEFRILIADLNEQLTKIVNKPYIYTISVANEADQILNA